MVTINNARVIDLKQKKIVRTATQEQYLSAPEPLVTEIEPIISNILWQDTFNFGAGIDAITGSVLSTAIKHFEPTQPTVKTSSEIYRFIQSDADLDSEIEASVSGKYNIEGVTVNAEAAYLSKIKYSELMTTLVAEYESYYDGYDEAETYELTDVAKNLIGNSSEFRKNYGDYFVAGCRRGSRFTAVFNCQASSVESMDGFKLSFGGEVPEIFSAEGSTRFTQAATDHKINISTYLFMEGYEGSPPSTSLTPEKIIDDLKWFKANEKGIKIAAKLKHYNTIDPTYPRTIDVPPDAFVSIRQLYIKLWDIRSQYASMPAYYQDQLKQDYQVLDYGIVSNQNILVKDEAKLQDYHQKADSLLSKFSDIAARIDFYYKVKKAPEPGKNQAFQETATGPQIWLYGYSTYSQSNAVVIHSTQYRYNPQWEACKSQVYNFQFGPDDKYLIVGWQVVSNWQDGTNGYWGQATDQILLTDNATVHVESIIGRGCDWSLIIYYVDAKDYQF